jgi:hypothetical protein
MRTRKRILVPVLVAVLLTAGGVVWAFRQSVAPPPHRINPDSFEQIRGGMTPAEVEAIIGVPPGDYSGTDGFFTPACPDQHVTYVAELPRGPTGVPESSSIGQCGDTWVSEQWSLYVGYHKGRVWVKECSWVEPLYDTFWDRIKAKLGW